MKRDKRKKKYIIVGCEHRFKPEPATSKSCDTCGLTQEMNECKDDILDGERCYTYKVIYY
jgi:hypothetical protein